MRLTRPSDERRAPDGPSKGRTSSGGGSHGLTRLSRLGLLAFAIGLVAIGAVAASLIVHGGSRGAAAKPVPLGTATVRLGNLIKTQRYTGVLSYPSRGSVGLSGAGTVTSLPHVGQIMTRGGSAAGVDDRSIGVLFGRTSLYRTLELADPAGAQLAVQVAQANLLAAEANLSAASQPSKARAPSLPAHAASVDQAQVNVAEARARLLTAEQVLRGLQTPQRGPDVTLVADNMTALGYYHGPSDSWSAALGDAVREWQLHIGATPTGDINPDDVLVLAGPARVSSVEGELGAAPSAVTLAFGSLSRVATFTIHNGTPAALTVGAHVRLSAADERAVGRVASVKTSHRVATVVVSFAQSARLARIGSTQVAMSLTIADQRNVLTVPTQALLALASGGYALQLPSGRLVAVHTSTVQGGRIEVAGAGVHAGMTVVSVT